MRARLSRALISVRRAGFTHAKEAHPRFHLMRFCSRAAPCGLVAVATLALAGCAWLPTQNDTSIKASMASAERPPVKTAAAVRTPAATPKVAVAEPVKPAYRVAAGPAPRPSAASAAAPENESSCTNVELCASILRAMVANPDRSWIGRPARPTTLANGVRLFAYRALGPTLSCGELAAALREVEAGQAALSGPVPGLDPERVARAKALVAEVGDELQAESAGRCGAERKVRAGNATPDSEVR